MTRRAALAIARDLRAAEHRLEAAGGPNALERREIERLLSSALARLISADDDTETKND
jgi:hypothetical protein